jgi:hypothetical protein
MIPLRRLVHKEGLHFACPLFYCLAPGISDFHIFMVLRTYFYIFIKNVRVLLTITHHLDKLKWLKKVT